MPASNPPARLPLQDDLISVELTINYFDSLNRRTTATLVFDQPHLLIPGGSSLFDVNSITGKNRGGALILTYNNVTRKSEV